MKATDTFKTCIEEYLKGAAKVNSVFAEKLKDPDKNIDDCVTYILNQVKKSGRNGFEDTEIFGMAMHYYDEKDIKPGSRPSAKIVMNQEVKLSEQEKEELRKEAKERVLREEMDKLRKKPKKATTPTKDEPGVKSLFD